MGSWAEIASAGDADEAGRMEAVVNAHEAALLRYAARILGNPDAAQDVVQNAFLKLFSRWRPCPQPGGSALRWLYRVTHNEAVDHVRREARLRMLHERHAAEHALGTTGHDTRFDGDCDRLDQVLALVRELRPAEQQVLLLRLQEGLSYKEISRVTGRTIGNVGCLLHNAVRSLSALMRRQGLLCAHIPVGQARSEKE